MVEPTDTAQPAVPVAAVSTIAAVSVKLPPFWPQDSEVWFAQMEPQFATRGVITAQKMKFDYVISSLTPEGTTNQTHSCIRAAQAPAVD